MVVVVLRGYRDPKKGFKTMMMNDRYERLFFRVDRLISNEMDF